MPEFSPLDYLNQKYEEAKQYIANDPELSTYLSIAKSTAKNTAEGLKHTARIAEPIMKYTSPQGYAFSQAGNPQPSGDVLAQVGLMPLDRLEGVAYGEHYGEGTSTYTGRGSGGRAARQGSLSGTSSPQSERLEGLPKNSPGPTQEIRDAAHAYIKENGLPEYPPAQYVKADPERGKRIADAFQAMEHNPDHPEVKKAYDALTKETLAQYQILKKMGIKVEPIGEGMENPYPNGSQDMISDVRNGHLWYFPTESGFGHGENNGHPLLAPTSEEANGKQMSANDVFRVVHDFFGHAKEGFGFGPHGEENAWRAHSQMYSPEARKALTSETRGQNSWVNFGPNGETNRANPEQTVYAEQKAGILPEWAHTEGAPIPHQDTFSGDDFPRQSEIYNNLGQWVRILEHKFSKERKVMRGFENAELSEMK